MENNNNDYVSVLQNLIRNYHKTASQEEVGVVISNNDGIIIVGGLNDCLLNEVLRFKDGSLAIALSLKPNYIGAIILNNYEKIVEGTKVYRTKHVFSAPVGDQLLGRIVNALGQPIDDQGNIDFEEYRPIEKIAVGVMERQSVSEPLATGILMIDSMFPIGRGQRQLIIGDRQTGKTAVAIDTIINQKGKNCYCIYVAISQKNSTVAAIANQLLKADALKYTTIVSASASDLPSLKYITPFTGITMAEYWMEKGKDVLIIYDDLSKHAIAYRTISLLLQTPPGREAYPGDVFYLHSRLLERAGRLNEKLGGGSITALPIVETQANDISAYIPTNVISITDGQLFMKTNLFNAGQKPAIDPGLSVSRVGSAAQIAGIKKLSGKLKLDLAQYNELAAFAQFGSDLDQETKIILQHGKKTLLMLRQLQFHPIEQVDQMALLFLIQNKYIKWIPEELIADFKVHAITDFYHEEVRRVLLNDSTINDFVVDDLHQYAKKLVKSFAAQNNNYDLSQFGDITELN